MNEKRGREFRPLLQGDIGRDRGARPVRVVEEHPLAGLRHGPITSEPELTANLYADTLYC
jgi:hypothetical protein